MYIMHMHKTHEKCVFWLTVKMTLHLLEITHISESRTVQDHAKHIQSSLELVTKAFFWNWEEM